MRKTKKLTEGEEEEEEEEGEGEGGEGKNFAIVIQLSF